MFEGIKPEVIRKVSSILKSPLCFVMIDRAELLFFMTNSTGGSKGTLAMWTDCKPFIEAMHILFSELWKNCTPFELATKEL